MANPLVSHPFRSPSVHGQALAKRALEIAAAGGHNVVLVGPPGCGRTMLAPRLPIVSSMTSTEALDVTKVYSVAGLLGARARVVATRPFRAPHPTASRVSLVRFILQNTEVTDTTQVRETTQKKPKLNSRRRDIARTRRRGSGPILSDGRDAVAEHRLDPPPVRL